VYNFYVIDTGLDKPVGVSYNLSGACNYCQLIMFKMHL